MSDTDTPARSGRIDVFAPSGTEQVSIDEAGSYVEIKRFNEGDRRKYLNKTSREVEVNADQSFKTTLDLTSDRDALLEIAIVGWDLESNGEPVVFSDTTKRNFMKMAPPDTIDDIIEAIRDLNPWLKNDTTVEELDEQIAALEELREELLQEEAGND